MVVGKPGGAERNQAVHPRGLNAAPAAVLLLVFQDPAEGLSFGPLADGVGGDAVVKGYHGLFQQRHRLGQGNARRGRHGVIGVFRAVGQQFVNGVFGGDAADGAARRDDGQRHDAAARPAGKAVDAERRPVGDEHHFRQQAGRAVPLPLPQQRQPDAGEHAHAGQAALVHNELPGAAHIVGVGRFAAEFQGEIAFHGGGKVAGSAVVDGPGAVGALLVAQIVDDVPLPFRVMAAQETA